MEYGTAVVRERDRWVDVRAGRGPGGSNLAKHRASFEIGAAVFDDQFYMIRDDRLAIGEYRLMAFGRVGPLLLAVVFSEPADDVIRLLSVRRASPAERKAYDEALR